MRQRSGGEGREVGGGGMLYGTREGGVGVGAGFAHEEVAVGALNGERLAAW